MAEGEGVEPRAVTHLWFSRPVASHPAAPSLYVQIARARRHECATATLVLSSLRLELYELTHHAIQSVGQNAGPLICGAGGMNIKLNSPFREWTSSGGKVTRIRAV